jgi:hypothetical protein
MFVQTFVSELAVDAFDIHALYGFAGTDEGQQQVDLVNQGIKHVAFKLQTVSHRDPP